MTALGIWASNVVVRDGDKDPQRIVIDEGGRCAPRARRCPMTWWGVTCAVVLFACSTSRSHSLHVAPSGCPELRRRGR